MIKTWPKIKCMLTPLDGLSGTKEYTLTPSLKYNADHLPGLELHLRIIELGSYRILVFS